MVLLMIVERGGLKTEAQMFESRLIAGICLVVCPIIYLVLTKKTVKEDIESFKKRDWGKVSSSIRMYKGLIGIFFIGLFMVLMEFMG